MTAATPWVYGPDTPTDRARTIARACWNALAASAPAIAEQIRELAAAHGEDAWLCPSSAPVGSGQWLTREQVARFGGVRADVVSNWSGRGLRKNGQHRRLTRHPEGYHPDEVTEFLAWRDSPRRAVSQPEESTP